MWRAGPVLQTDFCYRTGPTLALRGGSGANHLQDEEGEETDGIKPKLSVTFTDRKLKISY